MAKLKQEITEAKPGPRAPNGVRVYAVGDTHGRADLLAQLCDRFEIEAEAEDLKHQFVFLGDYVDRGANSAGVIDQLLAFGQKHPKTVFLKGNHEEAMLDFLADPEGMEGWIEWGGLQTLESYGLASVDTRSPHSLRDELAEKLPDDHFRFLLDLGIYHEAGDYIFVHAGLRAGIALEQQSERDLLWIRGEFYNTSADDWGTRCIVHGHTPQNSPINISWRINVDTGAFNSGKLTAVVLEGEDRRFVST